jgi:hypothetical protein
MITVTLKHLRTARAYELDFYVTKRHDQPLLGFKACRDLELLKPVDENICVVKTSKRRENRAPSTEAPTLNANCMTEAEILDEYADLFEGIGLLEGDVHFEVDDTVPAIQVPLRRLPIAVRDKVEAELKRLEANGIIAKVGLTEPIEWVSALLAVAKPNGEFAHA